MANKRTSRQAGDLTAHEQESALGGAASCDSHDNTNARAEQARQAARAEFTSPEIVQELAERKLARRQRRKRRAAWVPIEMAIFAAELGGELGEVRR